MIVLRIVGVSSIALSVLGLLYHASMIFPVSDWPDEPPYFYQAWIAKAGIDVALLVSGIVLGTGLTLGKTSWILPFVALQGLIVLNFVATGILWLHPTLGRSIAAASGISAGTGFGLTTLFPCWGSGLALWSAWNSLQGRDARAFA